MNQPSHGSMAASDKPTFTWLEASNAESYTFRLELYDQKTGKYTTAIEKAGITGSSYTPAIALQKNAVYRWSLTAINSADSVKGQGINGTESNVFMSPIDAKNHPANKGLNFSFSGSISKEVLCNYLSRSVIYSDEGRDGYGLTGDETARFILYTGAKYIGRASTIWSPSADDVNTIAARKKELAAVHTLDPDVIFEACIFECVNKSSINGIPIPSWVFTAFGKKPENRNFRYEDMVFADGRYKDLWGADSSVPDMTREETQMLFYYRACLFIDAGYEGLHMGQVHLIGTNDSSTGWKSWTKVLNMIRDYAKAHARRKFVLINAHTHGITGSDGLLMCDFHAYPLRLAAPDNSVAHIPTENDPQRVVFQLGFSDSIYGRSLGGKTHSGWFCDRLPYFVEPDNGWTGEYTATIDTPYPKDLSIWGMDDISWFANQPQSYRQEFLHYGYNFLKSLGEGGYLEMPGRRCCHLRSAVNPKSFSAGYYAANSSLFYDKGSDDEKILRDIWTADRQSRG